MEDDPPDNLVIVRKKFNPGPLDAKLDLRKDGDLILALESAILGLTFEEGEEILERFGDDAEDLNAISFLSEVRKSLVIGLSHPEGQEELFVRLDANGSQGVELERESLCKRAHQNWESADTLAVRTAFFAMHHHLPNPMWHIRRYGSDPAGGLLHFPPPPLGFCYTPDCQDILPLAVGKEEVDEGEVGDLFWIWPEEIAESSLAQMPPGVLTFREYAKEYRGSRHDKGPVYVRSCGQLQEPGLPGQALLPVPEDVREAAIFENCRGCCSGWKPFWCP